MLISKFLKCQGRRPTAMDYDYGGSTRSKLLSSKKQLTGDEPMAWVNLLCTTFSGRNLTQKARLLYNLIYMTICKGQTFGMENRLVVTIGN